jgi:hypothetical protein
MLPNKLFWLVFCLFRFNQNIETLCFNRSETTKTNILFSDNADTSFSASFSCFKLKLLSKDTLGGRGGAGARI